MTSQPWPPLDFTRCPVSGLPIHSDSRYLTVPVGDGYTVSFRRIGEHLVLANSCGDIGDADIDLYNACRSAFYKEFVQAGVRMVEIRDYQLCRGYPSRKSRQKLTEGLLAGGDHLCGFIFLNPPFEVRIIVRAGLALLRCPFPVLALNGYPKAIAAAKELLEAEEKSGVSSRHGSVAEGKTLPLPTDLPFRFLRGILKKIRVWACGVEPGIDQAHLDRFVDVLGSISWDQLDGSLGECGPSHPLRKAYDALTVVRLDVHHLLQEQQRVAAVLNELREKVHQAEKMQAIGQLAGGVAHDFNNQLAVVMGYADILCNLSLDSETVVLYADRIRSAANHSAGLTSKLLAFARMGDYRSEVIAVHPLIAEVFSFLQRSIDKRIILHDQCDATCSTVRGDPSQLENAILNLALNSRDAMPEGGELTISTRILKPGELSLVVQSAALRSGRILEIQVADTGKGIEPQYLPRIFEPFFTTKVKGKGTGMGLASVYGTITHLGGEISCKSTVGEGTVFTLLLPLCEEEVPQNPESVQATSGGGGGARILLIDDEPSVALLGQRMLEAAGYEVVTCCSSREAILLYRAAPDDFHLILLDVIMPEMNGREVFGVLKMINPDCRVALISGYGESDDIRDVLSQGALGILQKPFDMNQLTSFLAEIGATDLLESNSGRKARCAENRVK